MWEDINKVLGTSKLRKKGYNSQEYVARVLSSMDWDLAR